MGLETGKTVGIIGGGQLGRMLAMAAARLGLKTIVLDPQNDAPAFQCAGEKIIAAYDDATALEQLADCSHVITYEFENVPVDALSNLKSDIPVFPDPAALATSQDRLVEKTFFRDQGIGTASFHDVPDVGSLDTALAKTNGSGILKTRRFGYDGKGQIRLSPDNKDALEKARQLIASAPCILEGMISFEREISIIAARGRNGMVQIYDPAENVHKNGILHTSTVPAKINDQTTTGAMKIAETVLAGLDYVGIIGIEFFVLPGNELLVNEFAPRVHNSGHWTEAACTVPQFEQHIRAIAGMELGNPERHSNCRMENLIGEDVRKVPEILAMENTVLHLYGKSETRPGRKMGHFTKVFPKNGP